MVHQTIELLEVQSASLVQLVIFQEGFFDLVEERLPEILPFGEDDHNEIGFVGHIGTQVF